MKKEFDLGLFPKGDEMIGRLEGYTDYRRYFMYKLSRHIPNGEYVSIIANVTSIDLLLLNIVASIYRPFSVNAFGNVLLLVENFDHKIFAVDLVDRKTCNSSSVSANI